MTITIKPILLAEGIRSSQLENQINQPPPLLPLSPDRRCIDLWQERLVECFGDSIVTEIVVASSKGFQSFEPVASLHGFRRTVDPRSHRGTGGVLRDLFDRDRSEFDQSDYVVVIDRDACPPRTLEKMADELRSGVDAVVGVSELDRLVGLIAIKPYLLNEIPDRGYIDLKEQGLKSILGNGRRGTAVTIMPRAIRIRSLRSWLEAVRYHHEDGRREEPEGVGRLTGHSLVADSADITGAFVADSIIMENAVVGKGAVVARSVIPSGMRVPGGARVVDSVFFEENHKRKSR